MEKSEEQILKTFWDVVVIGGGPSGMMTAIQAAKRGKKVLLIEKNTSLGKKLLITGGGRCNLTNAETDLRKFLEKFKDSEQFLFSAFSQWNSGDTINFFNTKGMETKVEALGRVFPVSNSAESVWNVLVDELTNNNVTILSNTSVTGFKTNQGKIKAVTLKKKDGMERNISGLSFVLSTGGKSRPETGSTGDGFMFLHKLGHTVSEPSAALVPLSVKESWLKTLQGVSLENAKITVLQNGAKQETKKGKILFTHFGLSGPTILNMSRDIGELLKYDEVKLSLDVLPELDYGKLNLKLQEIISENSNKKFKNILSAILPAPLVPVVISLSKIDGETPSNSITRENRLKLAKFLKHIEVTVDKLLGEDKAIVTSGGVSLTEVDFKTMSSKLWQNLYLVGDILNIDRPSGGYSLQLCWTTGFIAGNNA